MRTNAYESGGVIRLTVRLSPEVAAWVSDISQRKAVELAFKDVVDDVRAVPKPKVEHVKGAIGRPRKAPTEPA